MTERKNTPMREDTEAPGLLPCPFCGASAKLMGGPMAQETYSIWCTNAKGKRHHLDCGTMDAKRAADEWNTRADLAKPKVKPLERHGDSKLGWTVDVDLLLEMNNEVHAAGWDSCLEVVEVVALSVERRILSALEGE